LFFFSLYVALERTVNCWTVSTICHFFCQLLESGWARIIWVSSWYFLCRVVDFLPKVSTNWLLSNQILSSSPPLDKTLPATKIFSFIQIQIPNNFTFYLIPIMPTYYCHILLLLFKSIRLNKINTHLVNFILLSTGNFEIIILRSISTHLNFEFVQKLLILFAEYI
jgi:hypothetical protein